MAVCSRHPGPDVTRLDLTFYGATPGHDRIRFGHLHARVRRVADFSRYPLNFISDQRGCRHHIRTHQVFDLTPAQVEGYTGTSPGYTEVTDYYIIRTENRPLPQLLRAVLVIGDPLADLRTWLGWIVNLATAPELRLLGRAMPMAERRLAREPNVLPQVIADALAAGTQEGIPDFTADLRPRNRSRPCNPAAATRRSGSRGGRRTDASRGGGTRR